MRTMIMALLAGLLSLGGAGRALADEAHHKGESVTMTDLPAAAQETLKREAKGAPIEELRKETAKDGTVTYKAEIVENDKGTDVAIGEDGKVLKRGPTHDEKAEHGKGERGTK
jgi:hypothetical protein